MEHGSGRREMGGWAVWGVLAGRVCTGRDSGVGIVGMGRKFHGQSESAANSLRE